MFKRIKEYLFVYAPEIVTTASALLVFSFLALYPKPLSKEAALLGVGQKVIRLVDPGTHSGGGTGFSVRAPSGESYTLTNAHICDIAEQGELHASAGSFSNRYTVLRVIEISRESDLCVLTNMPNFKGLALADKLTRGEEVTIVGHPLLEPTTVAVGQVNAFQDITLMIGENLEIDACEKRGGYTQRVSDFFSRLFGINSMCLKQYMAARTDAVIYPGNSGSPVLNSGGDVVGVVFAGSGATNWGFIVPLNDIKKFLSIY